MNLQKTPFFLVFLALLTGLSPSFAQEKGGEAPPVQTYEDKFSSPDFEASWREERENSPLGDTGAGYSIRIPSDWTENIQKEGTAEADSGIGAFVFEIAGRYIGAPRNLLRSSVNVEVQKLKNETTAKDWFSGFILEYGLSPNALSVLSENELEAIYIQVVQDQTSVIRARVIINGPYLFLVRYILPQENYEQEKAQQWAVLKSFKVLEKKQTSVELQKTYAFLDQSLFDYPRSWILKTSPILAVDRMQVLLYRKADLIQKDEAIRYDGKIKVVLVSRLLKTTLANEVQDFRKSIVMKGYKIGKVVERISYNHHETLSSSKAEAYSLIPDNPVKFPPYELVVCIMQGKDYYYITSLVTPSRETDRAVWSRNMRAYQIVNESMRRRNVRVDESADDYFNYLNQQ